MTKPEEGNVVSTRSGKRIRRVKLNVVGHK